jgi:hypothetical protein
VETLPDGALRTATCPPTGQGDVGRELDSTGELGMAEDVTLSRFMMCGLASKQGSQVSSQHRQDI